VGSIPIARSTEMAHFVQYHKPEKMGGAFLRSGRDFSIQTNKFGRVRDGDVVWLFTGVGRPRQYSLCQRFVASKVVSQVSGKFKYRVSGTDGRSFQITMGKSHLLQELLRITGRGGLGLQPIKNRSIVDALERLSQS
jgi:hypothetical protein